jgi:toxin secretion/phage lysis holin
MQSATGQHLETGTQVMLWGKIALGAVGAILVNFPQALALLMGLMAIDYITGLAAAVAARNLESGAAVRGLAKKIVIGGAAIAGFMASRFIPEVMLAGFNLGQIDIGSAVAFAFALSEGISILENVGRAGIALPAPLRMFLSRLKHMDNEGYPVTRENPAGEGSIVKP